MIFFVEIITCDGKIKSFTVAPNSCFLRKFKIKNKLQSVQIGIDSKECITFVPNGILMIVHMESTWILTQNNHQIFQIPDNNSKEHPLVFRVIPLGISFFIDILFILLELKNLHSLNTMTAPITEDLVHMFTEDNGSLMLLYITDLLKTSVIEKSYSLELTEDWKEQLRGSLEKNHYLFLERINNETGKKEEVLVLLTKNDIIMYENYREACYFQQMPDVEEINVIYLVSKELNVVEPMLVETCMTFISRPLFGQFEKPSYEKYTKNIEDGFKYQYMYSSDDYVIKSLLEQLKNEYDKWTGADRIMAPLVPVCQGSGSGKSRTFIQILKSMPGFYLVLRKEGHSGFPLSNAISTEFFEVANLSRDSAVDLSSWLTQDCQVGRFLELQARIICSVIQAIVFRFAAIDNSLSNDEKFKEAMESYGEIFESNEHLKNFSLISREELLIYYHESFHDKALTVKTVSSFISALLNRPFCVLPESKRNIPAYIEACNRISKALKSFPFLFVLDEADLISTSFESKSIANVSEKKSASGFQAYRRSLGYLEASTCPYLSVAIGTRGDISKLNPPIIDPSSRFQKRSELSDTLIFSGNSNILAKKYRITGISPTYESLLNPIMFKFLVTRNRPLWGIYPFSSVVELAQTKLENGSRKLANYVLAIWMLRAGMTANPLHTNVHNLVANHVATLFSISLDREMLRVMYPSDPILAMARRCCLSAAESRIANAEETNYKEILYTKLKECIESIQIERGDFAESFAAMNILMAIDRSKNECETNISDKYNEKLSEIKSESHECLHELWEKKESLYESSTEPNLTIISSFPDYHVTTVRSFLGQLYGIAKFSKIESFLPQETLDGLVNVSHFVRLNRNLPGCADDSVKESRKPPIADIRVKDYSRNVIDRALLVYGLMNQCGFFVPSSYYGIDLVLPVSLKGRSGDKGAKVTFIGVQVKSGPVAADEDVYLKMAARLHYVKCPHVKPVPKSEPPKLPIPCSKCTVEHEANWKEIYSNQISLLMCFTPRDLSSGETCLMKNRWNLPENGFEELWAHLSPTQHNELFNNTCFGKNVGSKRRISIEEENIITALKKTSLDTKEISKDEKETIKDESEQETRKEKKEISKAEKEAKKHEMDLEKKRIKKEQSKFARSAALIVSQNVFTSENYHLIQFDPNLELCAFSWDDSKIPLLPVEMKDGFKHRMFSIGSFGWDSVSNSLFAKDVSIPIGTNLINRYDDLSDITKPTARKRAIKAFELDSSPNFPFQNNEISGIEADQAVASNVRSMEIDE
jgi:hypothetical protein